MCKQLEASRKQDNQFQMQDIATSLQHTFIEKHL